METILKLNEFTLDKINNLDQSNKNCEDVLQKLKNTSMRLAYSKILDNFYQGTNQLAYSHYHQALLYLQNDRIDQCIHQIRLASKKLHTPDCQDNTDKKVSAKISHQDIKLVLIQCYLKKEMYQQSLILLNELKSVKNKQKYLRLKSNTYQLLNDQQKSRQSFQEFYSFIQNKYGNKSVETGLCRIQIGKNYGYFKSYQKGIKSINKGIQTLIQNKYNNPLYVSKVYQTLASYYKKVQEHQKQYTSLICAQSMAKQLKEGDKTIIQILTLLAKNLYKRQEKQRALEEYLKIQKIQKKIYGETSCNLSKTIRKIIHIMHELNRQHEARKYEVEYEHLVGSRIQKIKKC